MYIELTEVASFSMMAVVVMVSAVATVTRPTDAVGGGKGCGLLAGYILAI